MSGLTSVIAGCKDEIQGQTASTIKSPCGENSPFQESLQEEKNQVASILEQFSSRRFSVEMDIVFEAKARHGHGRDTLDDYSELKDREVWCGRVPKNLT